MQLSKLRRRHLLSSRAFSLKSAHKSFQYYGISLTPLLLPLGETKGNKNLARHKGGSRPLQPLRLSNLNRRDGNPVHKICPLAIILPSIMCLWWHQSHVRLPAQPSQPPTYSFRSSFGRNRKYFWAVLTARMLIYVDTSNP